MDFVAIVCTVEADAARPEFRDAADHRPAVFLEPCLVAGREPVLPLRDGDVGVDVHFAIHLVGEVRRMVDAGFRIGFPRIHRAARVELLRARARRFDRAMAEHHDRFRALRMQQQQRGEHHHIPGPADRPAPEVASSTPTWRPRNCPTGRRSRPGCPRATNRGTAGRSRRTRSALRCAPRRCGPAPAGPTRAPRTAARR